MWYVIMGLLSGSVMAFGVLALVVPDIRAERETPARVAGCHDRAGTAQLDTHGVFVGCLVPPKSQP
jgi:hypothetical protein